MMNLKALKVSYHFQNDRQGRKERIDAVINGNWGQVVKEEWYKGAWRCLTDTGLIFIVEEKKEIILTYYFATMSVVNGMYHGGKVPKALHTKVQRNASKYRDIYETSVKNDYYKEH